SAELTYVMAMPDIANQFPRDMFENWMQRYLGDHLPPEDVEENSRQLQMIITRARNLGGGSGSSWNLEELHHWFVAEQKSIQNMDLDPAQKQAKLLHLQEMFVSLSERFVPDPGTAIVPMIPHKEMGLLTNQEIQEEKPPQAKAE